MSQSIQNLAYHTEIADADWRGIFKLGGAAALVQLAILLMILITSFTLELKPNSVEDYFTLLHNNRLAGLLQADFTILVLIALYLPMFFGLYGALRRVNNAYVTFATILTFVAVTTCFATHSGFSLLHLSDQYAAATTEAQRTRLLAAGEAVIASNMWNSSGAYLAGILMQGAGVLISVVMLRSKDFSKIAAFAGILANGFDLIQHILHPFAPSVSATLLMISGPFYLLWFPMLGRDLWRLARGGSKADNEPLSIPSRAT